MDFRQLIHLVGDYLVQFNPPHHNPEMQANQQQQIDDALSTLPKLGRGLDVNVRFQKVTDFEYTDELSVLDMLGINLFHGWLVDPQDVKTLGVIRDMSYNQLLCLLVDADSNHRPSIPEKQADPGDTSTSGAAPPDNMAGGVPENESAPSTSQINQNDFNKWRSLPSVVSWFQTHTSRTVSPPVSEPQPAQKSLEQEPSQQDVHVDDSAYLQKLKEAQVPVFCSVVVPCSILVQVVQTFLQETASQLTYYGIEQLHATVKEGELCVFFRNNHFCTMCKKSGGLYLLVTDVGFYEEEKIVS